MVLYICVIAADIAVEQWSAALNERRDHGHHGTPVCRHAHYSLRDSVITKFVILLQNANRNIYSNKSLKCLLCRHCSMFWVSAQTVRRCSALGGFAAAAVVICARLRNASGYICSSGTAALALQSYHILNSEESRGVLISQSADPAALSYCDNRAVSLSVRNCSSSVLQVARLA